MNIRSLDWPQGASSLLSQTRSASADDGEFLRLIMAGTQHIDSWLIENKVLPALREKGLHVLHFTLHIDEGEDLSVKILPLPDGSAFACATDGLCSPFEAREALHEISYLGYRYAPRDDWQEGFQAVLQCADGASRPLAPSDVADFWRQTTGLQPDGYASGAIDHLQALGSEMLDKAFHARGRLGL